MLRAIRKQAGDANIFAGTVRLCRCTTEHSASCSAKSFSKTFAARLPPERSTSALAIRTFSTGPRTRSGLWKRCTRVPEPQL